MDILKKNIITGFVVGIILAVFNTFLLGFPGMIFDPFLNWLSFSTGCFAGGDGCWGTAIILGDVLFIIFTPAILIFLKYIFDKEKFPYTTKKIINIIFILIIFFIINVAAFLENSLKNLSANFDGSGMHSFASFEECKKIQSGECYGYVASLKNDINLCDKYLNDYSDKDYMLAECVISFSINKNNINFCNQIKGPKKELYLNKCKAKYYIAKNEKNKCDNILDSYWKKECDTHTGAYYYFLRMYAQIRGEDYN